MDLESARIYNTQISNINSFNTPEEIINTDYPSMEEVVNQDNGGGGLATFIHHSIEAVLVSEGNEEAEFITVEANLGGMQVRLINAYGKQEKENVEKREKFFQKLDEEIVAAKLQNKGIIMELDANSKLGPDFIKNDKHEMSENGKLLLRLVQRNDLIVINSLDICEGLITRERITDKVNEQSTIDFIIVCRKMLPFVTRMIIDEARAHVLTKYAKEN